MSMSHAPALKTALKRGALIAAANWPLVVVQFIAESTLKLILGVPVVGGIFLVVLLLDANVEELLRGDVREIVAAVFSALRANPAALTSFAMAFLVVLIGGSVLTFVVKGGTVAVLVEADDHAGAIERPPLRLQMLRRANRTGIDPFLDGCRRLGWRYVKLGLGLLVVYAITAAAYFGLLFGGYALADNVGVLLWWTVIAAAASSAVIVWITLVNFLYLITQIVMAVDDVGLRSGARDGRTLPPLERAGDRGDLRRGAAARPAGDRRIGSRDGRPRPHRLRPDRRRRRHAAADCGLARARHRLPVSGADSARRLPHAVSSLSRRPRTRRRADKRLA